MNKSLQKSLLAALLLALPPALPGPLAAQVIPQFTVELQPLAFGGSPPVPALHSFARAIGSGGQWLIVSGRTNGLHTFPSSTNGSAPENAFPPKMANAQLWVIDPVAQKVYPPAAVPAPPLGDSLTVTNALFAQDGDTLYVAGGYGNQTSTGAMQTFPTLTAIPVSATIAAIMAGKPLPPFPQVTNWYDCLVTAQAAGTACAAANGPAKCQGTQWQGCVCVPGPDWHQCMQNQQNACNQQQSQAQQACNQSILAGDVTGIAPSPTTGPSYITVTGGEMEKVGDVFWVMLGQNFQGIYSVDPADYGKWPLSQVYTQQMAALYIGELGGQLSAAVLGSLQADPNTNQWHRRDLNVEPALDTDGSEMLAVYGGVFVPGQIAAFDQPIYLKGPQNPLTADATVDSYQQLFSLYDCATLKLWSASQSLMQTVFFGGIGLYYISPNNHTLQKDTGLPFVNTLSVLSRTSTGATSEVYAATPLPAFLGSDANFFPNPAAPRQASGSEILALDQIQSRTLAGWIYGGIVSPQAQPLGGTTMASNAVYQVWITPGAPPASFWTPGSASDQGVLKPQH